MTEEQIKAGCHRLAKIDGWIWIKEINGYTNGTTKVAAISEYFNYHTDRDAIARIEQKIQDKYPYLWCSTHGYGSKIKVQLPFLTEWLDEEKEEIIVAIYAETEPLARFESALKVLDILGVK